MPRSQTISQEAKRAKIVLLAKAEVEVQVPLENYLYIYLVLVHFAHRLNSPEIIEIGTDNKVYRAENPIKKHSKSSTSTTKTYQQVSIHYKTNTKPI